MAHHQLWALDHAFRGVRLTPALGARDGDTRPIRVLYLHPSGPFSGAARSLLELLRALPPGAVEPNLILPKGQAAEIFAREGYAVLVNVGVTQFDCTRHGHYRGLRWLIVLREIGYLPATILAALRWRHRRLAIDLIHANEVTAVLSALIFKFLLNRPLVVHTRSVQQTEGIPLRRRLLLGLLKRKADAVIAIDETVCRSLAPGVDPTIIHNGFAPRSDEPVPHAIAALRQRFRAGTLRVGMVGSLLELKGVYEFVEAARIAASTGMDAEFVLIGSNVRRLSGVGAMLLSGLGFARDVERELRRFIVRHGLQDRIHLVGFVPEVSAVYQSLDLLCFPSHLNAVGRPVLEAAWFGVPSIAAVDDPLPDTFVDGETGIRVPARDPAAIADVVGRLCADRAQLARMGVAARALAERNFDSKRNALRILEIYRRVCDRQA